MKRTKFSLMMAVIVCMLSLTPIPRIATADGIDPGTVCQPANLNQALAFGLGWSQKGVRNNSPVVGGTPFFVVCPNTFILSQSTPSLFVGVQRLDAAATPIRCTLFQLDPNGNNVAAAQTVTAAPGAVGTNVFISFTQITSAHINQIVCAMFPQTQITFINDGL